MRCTRGVRASALSLLLWNTIPLAAAQQKILSSSSDKGSPLDSAFEKLVLETLDEWHVPGLSIAVVNGDETWAAGYGNATFPSTPATPSTLYYAGSTTKAFTAAVISLLIDSGNFSGLGWRAPLSSLIRDDFVLMPEYAWAQEHLTLEDALSHRTGFPRHDKSLGSRYVNDKGAAHPATVADLTRSLRHLPMVTEPRTDYRYCNLMFMVASHAVQVLTGSWLGDLMRDLIWRPLGMDGSYFSLEDALAAPQHLASGYYWDYDDSKSGGYHEVPFVGLREGSGAGAVVSNVLDYARWLRCLLDETPPLSKAGHAAVKTPRITPAGGSSAAGFDGPGSYALGWISNTYKGHRVLTHSGGMLAYGANVWFFPGLRYGVVAMGNTAVTSNMAANLLGWRLMDDRLGVPEGERYDRKPGFQKLLDGLLGQFDKAVDELYPDRAAPPVPRALPLEAYTGMYFHPGYLNMTITTHDGEEEGRLRAVREDFVWQMTFDFVHASGEYWAVLIDMKDSPNRLNGQVAKAEFRIGPDGRASALVAEFLEEGSEGIITFDKIA
ncbi:putative penicillin-binding protein [Pestalotiopsis sp. NC0098]|nr:putative penicillin-binding protein [Pestalotiopsis sp. NC0098]